ncbi:DUF2291 domain-containing protein [Spirosoma aerophilum]
MTTPLKYVAGLLLLGIVGYNSVYFRKLDDVKATGLAATGKFDAGRYADTFWSAKLVPAAPASATDLITLLPLLTSDPEKAFATHSQALGIGNIRYFLVKGEGTVSAVGENDVTVSLATGPVIHLATEFIFGNAVRDASGIIKITEFDNTADLNAVAANLNDIVRKKVIPALKTRAKTGSRLSFIGAMELNRAHLHLDELTVIPISIN